VLGRRTGAERALLPDQHPVFPPISVRIRRMAAVPH
jgi:hypothetical protein